MTYKYVAIKCVSCKTVEIVTVDVDSKLFDIEHADMDSTMDCNECWSKLMEPES